MALMFIHLAFLCRHTRYVGLFCNDPTFSIQWALLFAWHERRHLYHDPSFHSMSKYMSPWWWLLCSTSLLMLVVLLIAVWTVNNRRSCVVDLFPASLASVNLSVCTRVMSDSISLNLDPTHLSVAYSSLTIYTLLLCDNSYHILSCFTSGEGWVSEMSMHLGCCVNRRLAIKVGWLWGADKVLQLLKCCDEQLSLKT